MGQRIINRVVEAEIHTIRRSIGGVGVAGADFNFVTAANMNEQPIDLGDILPPFCRVLDVFCYTVEEFTGSITLSTDVGLTTGAADFLGAVDLFSDGTFNQLPVAGMPLVDIAAAAQHVWVNSTPGANWSLQTAGLMQVYVTYIDVTYA